MTTPVIGLLTDFGEKDYFVAAMKAVILSINPEVAIIDIAHSIPAFDLRAAAFTLWAVADFFPAGAIFVVVVDPQVGSARKIMVARGAKHFFIGPDNGVLSPALEKEGCLEARELRERTLFLPQVSSTFEGRDKMAPAAAWISRGIPFRQVGPVLRSWERIIFPQPGIFKDRIEAEILHVDRFGNLITNVSGEKFLKWYRGKKGQPLAVVTDEVDFEAKIATTFAGGPAEKPLLIVGSSGYLEIAYQQASASQKLKCKAGDKLVISRGKRQKEAEKGKFSGRN
jgi:S-adenosylmethionine hydrolase